MEADSQEALNGRLREVAQAAQSVHGFIDEHAGALLYQFARFIAPVPTVVELGSWRGRSTIWLAAGMLDRGEGQVHAVDTWQGTPHEPEHQSLLAEYGPDDLFNEFWGNIMSAGLADQVEPVRSPTVEAARGWPGDRQIGLLFIDADHNYEAVRRDFEFWSPFVAPGGYIVFDDVPDWQGPTRLITELPKWFRFLNAKHNLMAFQRIAG